ncbi:Phenylacetyl-CoA 1,2-epoxidase [Lentibacillus sp. JNUCC-1]|uniref:1,2-phenylacetyl-CoA epoxidase subunit PaaC n=1 Tax=Lentibacillus sp. JNUCC-1 TaxID=2654513 RepID=UPI0012E7DED0|nr:1,2-phenylacetyl-CoA epoxidase subunit PaaC [Lentibacillus sp. JNUCC-1]MUV37547.1 Phenylacetyl-CoA 1,2-epoxidase [Lentibacillus sp. JNUCC-1]
MMHLVTTAREAQANPTYSKALKELLYQLADDDFIMAFRGSEWLGLAPHIEEDVAYSSITQNTMGHAVMYYTLLEGLGEGDADVIAHERLPGERRNAVYFERQNGDGAYWEEPYYDWALAVVRNVLYETFKKAKLEAVARSTYKPLALAAEKVLLEQSYHLAHWSLWLRQLQGATDEAKHRIHERMQEAWSCIGDVPLLGEEKQAMEQYGLIGSETDLAKTWKAAIHSIVADIPGREWGLEEGNGRLGEHTGDLDQALVTFAEVYNSDRTAVW